MKKTKNKKFKFKRPKVVFDQPNETTAECIRLVTIKRYRIGKKRYTYKPVEPKGAPDEPVWFLVIYKSSYYIIDEENSMWFASWRYREPYCGGLHISTRKQHLSPDDRNQINMAIEKYCEQN